MPSTTQKPCWTVVTSAIVTATAIATAPRMLLTNQTDRTLAWAYAVEATLDTRLTVRAAAVRSGVPALPPGLEPFRVGEPARDQRLVRGRQDGDGDAVGVERDLRDCAEVIGSRRAGSRRGVRSIEPRHDRFLATLELIDVRVCVAAGEEGSGVSAAPSSRPR